MVCTAAGWENRCQKGLGRDEIEDAETGLVVRKAKVRVVPNMEPYELAGMEGSGAVIGVGVGAVGDTRGTWCNVRTTYGQTYEYECHPGLRRNWFSGLCNEF